MTAIDELVLLSRMEAARRQTRAHLDLVERQIEGRAERMTTTARVNSRRSGRLRSIWTPADVRLFRQHVECLGFERRAEIDALSRKLARQERAIAAFRERRFSFARAA